MTPTDIANRVCAAMKCSYRIAHSVYHFYENHDLKQRSMACFSASTAKSLGRNGLGDKLTEEMVLSIAYSRLKPSHVLDTDGDSTQGNTD